MIFEKIIFSIIAFSMFILMFFKITKRNDTNYVIMLVIEFIGILISFIEIIFSLKYNIIFKMITYLLAIILPAIIFILEKKEIYFSEILYLSLAKILSILGNNKTAKNMLIKLQDKYPESYYSHIMLAKIYEQEGGMRKAIDEYVIAVDLNKKDYDSYYKISNLLYDLDKKDDAELMLKNLINIKPDYLKATLLLGDILCEKENYKEALSIYMDGLKHNPDNYEIYYNMGITYTMLNDFENAKISYEKAAIINTLLYNAYYNLGQINLISGDLSEAEKYFSKCIENPANDADAYYNLAKIYMLRGEHTNAINAINLAIELDNEYIKIANEENAFNPIKSKIKIPKIEEEDIVEKDRHLSEKEIKLRKHLSDIGNLVNKLSDNKGLPNQDDKINNKEREK